MLISDQHRRHTVEAETAKGLPIFAPPCHKPGGPEEGETKGTYSTLRRMAIQAMIVKFNDIFGPNRLPQGCKVNIDGFAA